MEGQGTQGWTRVLQELALNYPERLPAMQPDIYTKNLTSPSILPRDPARAFLANYPKIPDSPPALAVLAVAFPAVAPGPGLPAREAVRHYASDNSNRQQCAHRR